MFENNYILSEIVRNCFHITIVQYIMKSLGIITALFILLRHIQNIHMNTGDSKVLYFYGLVINVTFL